MQQTDWQKTLEVVVKGFVGAIVALAGLWVLGWLFTFIGSVLIGLAGIVVALLKFLVPVAVISAIVYFFVSQLQSSTSRSSVQARVEPKPIEHAPATTIDAVATANPESKVSVGTSSTSTNESPKEEKPED
jgi:predicted lipid-binding transport protein (Tim44 family)